MTLEPKPSEKDNFGFPPEYTVMHIQRSNTYIVALGTRSVRVPGAMLRVAGGKEAAMAALQNDAVDLSESKSAPPRRLKPGDHGYYAPGGLEPTGKKFVGDDKDAKLKHLPTSSISTPTLPEKVTGHDVARNIENLFAHKSARTAAEKGVLTNLGMSKPPRREVPGMADLSTLVTKGSDPSRKGEYLGPRGDVLDRDQWQELFLPVTVLEEDFAHGYMVRTSWVPAYPSPANANWESVCISQTDDDPLHTADLMWRYFTYDEALRGHALLLREVIAVLGKPTEEPEPEPFIPDEEL